MAALDSHQRRTFMEDGFLIIKNFFDTELVDRLRKACDDLTSDVINKHINTGILSNSLQTQPLESRLIQLKEINSSLVPLLFRAELHHPAFFELFGNKKLLYLVSQLLPTASEIRVFPNYSIRPKLPNYDPHEIVWHQDAGLAADGRPSTTPVYNRLNAFGPGRTVNVWTPLVEATPTTGCMKFIPGSHKLGIQNHELAYKTRQQEVGHTYGIYTTQIDPKVVSKHEASAVDMICSPGDIIVFSNLLIHRGGNNTSDIVRWSLDWRYQDTKMSTHREENGHVMWSDDNQDRVIKTAEQWAQLSLS